MPQQPPSIIAESRAQWRQWLADNHATEIRVWLRIYKKNSGIPSVTYDEAVDEALCFGWIDSPVKKGDAQYYLQYFARRKPKSNWSGVNKGKVANLTAAGLMAEAGMAMVRLANETGPWTALDELEGGIIPPDLRVALAAKPLADRYFNAFPRSARRGILEWLLNAKTLATRTRRITEIVEKATRTSGRSRTDLDSSPIEDVRLTIIRISVPIGASADSLKTFPARVPENVKGYPENRSPACDLSGAGKRRNIEKYSTER